MIDLDFAVTGVKVPLHSASPLLALLLRVTNSAPDLPIEHVLLQTQVRIAATHREYGPGERDRLSQLFGAAADWDRSLRDLLWTNANVSIPAFEAECDVELPLPCSYDFNIAATKYFHGVENGEAPLSLLFSGTVFFRNPDGDLQITQIAHHKEASYRLPVRVWREMMAHYYLDSLWLRISRELFERLHEYQRRNGLATAEDALHKLLATEFAGAPA